jgi:hypothetical protein
MALDNLVAVQIPPADLESIRTKVAEIESLLNPYLISLSPQKRKELPKMGEGTGPFVNKALEYAKTNPQIVPPFVNISSFDIDVSAVTVLNTILRPLQQLVSKLDDTIVLSGSEAYVAALNVYHSVKQASKTNVAGTKTIFEDLKVRFDRPNWGTKKNTP